MPSSRLTRTTALSVALGLSTAGVVAVVQPWAQASFTPPASLTAGGLTQDFNGLVSTGTGTEGATPAGVTFLEASTNANTTYTAGTGSANAGDTYSFGAASAADRALGQVRSGGLVSTLGFVFRNNSGSTVTQLSVGYTGEQWRLGTAGRADRLDFQYSLNATSLAAGTYVDVDALDFVAPTTTGTVGPLDGNAAANRTARSGTISGLAIAPGADVTFRWNDADATGADDGLGIDDLTVTPTVAGGNQAVVPTCPSSLTTAQGTAANAPVSASDADGTVTSASITSTAVAGITLDGVTPAAASGGTLTATLNVASSTAPGSYSVVIGFANDDSTPQTASCTIAVTVNAPAAVTKISAIQGAGATSPLNGQTVTIEGIVTGVDDEVGASFGSGNAIVTFPSDAGIYVQEETADQDADPSTSEGIFVGFVRTRSNYPLGTKVRLNGTVRDSAGAPSFGFTKIEETVNEEPQILSAGNPLPPAVTIDPAAASGQNPMTKPYYETLESMRVRLAQATAVSGGTNKFGELFLVPGAAGRDALLRTDPVRADLLGTIDHAGAGDPANPFRNPDEAANGARVDADQFDTVTELVGPLNFSFGNFKVAAQVGGLPIVTDTGVTYPYDRLLAAGPGQVRVASYNVENLFPTGGLLDGGTITAAEFDEAVERDADAIGRLLKAPDLVAVQEVGDNLNNGGTTDSLATLQVLATRLGQRGYGTYTAHALEGNDTRGIDVGFLVKSTLTVNSPASQIGGGKTATNPTASTCSDVSGRLFDRPPLAIDVTAPAPVGRFTAFSNHFASKAAPDACRVAQATFVRDQADALETAGQQVLVTGDLNAFEDEGALTVLEGSETTLTNQRRKAVADEAYSFQFNGLLQTLDHVLVTDGLDALVTDSRYAHINNDYFDRATSNDGHKSSDHDPPVITLGVDATPTPVVPEAPVAALLPLVALALGGSVLVARRRRLA